MKTLYLLNVFCWYLAVVAFINQRVSTARTSYTRTICLHYTASYKSSHSHSSHIVGIIIPHLRKAESRGKGGSRNWTPLAGLWPMVVHFGTGVFSAWSIVVVYSPYFWIQQLSTTKLFNTISWYTTSWTGSYLPTHILFHFISVYFISFLPLLNFISLHKTT